MQIASSPGQHSSLAGKVGRRRWRIALLLGLGILVNFFDRVNLSAAHAALHTEFGISDITFGYLSASYAWTYGLCQIPVGVLLDKFGVRRIGRISTFLWSLASFGAALAPGMGAFFTARLLLGVGEAPTFPANAKAVGKWFPAQERSFATSIFDAAAKLASAVGIPVLGLLLLRFGWRWSFATTGVVSFLYFLLFYKVYRDPEADPRLTNAERDFILSASTQPAVNGLPSPEPVPFAWLIRQRKVLGMALGFGAYNYTFYLLLTWLPSYLSSQLHMDLLHSFLYTGVPWLIAAGTDLCIGGLLVDALIKRGSNPDRVRRAVLLGGTALGLGIVGAAHVQSKFGALAWITISISGLAAAAPVAWSLPSLISPQNRVGTVGGIMNFSSQLSAIAAPIVTGYIVSTWHSFSLAFTVAAAYLMVGIAGYLLLLGRIESMSTPWSGRS
jgi:ACS family D-galactonate transporter-like MFS transporter